MQGTSETGFVGTSLPKTSSAGIFKISHKLPFLFLCGLFVLGMLYGVLLMRGGDGVYAWLTLFVREYVDALRVQSLLKSFFSAFSAALLFVFAAYFLGFSAIGQPFAFLVPFFKGLGLGAFMGYLYAAHGLAGVGYCVLILLPHTLIALLAILIGCREAIRLSCTLFASLCTGRGKPLETGALRLYHVKFLILALFCVASAGIHALCVLFFAGLFQF